MVLRRKKKKILMGAVAMLDLSQMLFFFSNLLVVLGLRCCMWAFSSCGKRGLLFIAVHGLLIAVASLCCRSQALGVQVSVAVAHGLSSCGYWALERRLSSCGSRA